MVERGAEGQGGGLWWGSEGSQGAGTRACAEVKSSACMGGDVARMGVVWRAKRGEGREARPRCVNGRGLEDPVWFWAKLEMLARLGEYSVSFLDTAACKSRERKSLWGLFET